VRELANYFGEYVSKVTCKKLELLSYKMDLANPQVLMRSIITFLNEGYLTSSPRKNIYQYVRVHAVDRDMVRGSLFPMMADC
jgi:hypothetical protein